MSATAKQNAKIADLKDARVPTALYWSVEDVTKWIEELGFPQYKDCFQTNGVDGKKLIVIDASSLPKLGITDFDDIKLISKTIRDLLGIDEPFWNRTISRPNREELGMYLERKSVSGDQSAELSYNKFDNYWPDLKWYPPLANHCLILPHD